MLVLRMTDIDQYKFWKISIRELYSLGFILDSDLIRLHNRLYYETQSHTPTEARYYLMVIDIMKNHELFKHLVREELDIISNGKLPTNKLNFKKIWISYILDCIDYELIESHAFMMECNKITFDGSQWSEYERQCAYDIINKVRLGIIKSNPNAIDFLENPAFEVLMAANDMEYIRSTTHRNMGI